MLISISGTGVWGVWVLIADCAVVWCSYDEELPGLCRDFLHNLASRRLSSLRI